MGWTLTKRDRGGRVVSVQTYPGTNPPAPWGTNSSHTGDSTFSYSANATTISDQAGKARTNTVDGLGRLISVAEPGPNTTSYTYDVMDNLTFVNQPGQNRSFVYSSLSRLTSAANPESGTISYFYDNNGNLARKVDARNITTCFGVWNGSTCNSAVDTGYDRLNRVLKRQYSDGTPAVTYAYDSATNGKGLLRSVANSESTANYTAYDKLARVTASNQVTSGYTYPMSYTWDIAGNLRTLSLPSSRTLAWSYDNAGRVNGVTGAKSGEANKTYASGIGYAPHGALASLTMGNSMVESWNYNSRLQPRQVSAARSGTTHLQLGFYYCGSQLHTCGDNNGNLRIQTLGIPGQSWTQNYGYDGVNRLTSVSEAGGAGWSQSFGYDATGNRWVSAYTNLVPQPQTPATSNWYNTANNRLKSASYDAAGNQTTLGALTLAYDAEGRATQAQKSVVGQSWTTLYKYDGEGRRVKKVDAAGATTVFVYDATGNLAAEYYSGAATATKGVEYLTADHLGSTRMIANETGTVVARRDYQPFGEEIPASIGGRPALYDTQTGVKQQFTGKERDAETGLDYFGARYLAGVLGRWTGADEPLVYSDRTRPQSWNLYLYTYNNPLSFVDPDGHEPCKNGQNPENGNICTVVTAEKEKSRVTPRPDVPLDSPLFLAAAQGVRRAEPGVRLAGAGLMTFFAAVAPVSALLTDCVAGGPGCDKANIGFAVIPGLAKIRLGATVVRTGRGVHAAEILDKTGGFAQAADDFRVLEGGAERMIGKVRVKEFPDGAKAILRDFSRDGRPTLEIQHAAGETTKFRYNP